MRNRFMRVRRQKGSALLVSLMIMVGLSLLGLGFVAISETESAIAVNERNYVQAQSAAETGAKAVIQMFQNADWAKAEGILPQNISAFKIERCHDTTCGSLDYYKPTAGDLLFNFPFKGANGNRFYGDVDSPDVYIRLDGSTGTAYLNALSQKLFYSSANAIEKLRISEIRVYAPPWPDASRIGVDKASFSPADVNGSTTPTSTNGWFTGGSRFGVATVRVTAQKVVAGSVRAERSVKAVIAETPFPTVDGAIETSGSLVGQGNFNVYWGKILSEKDMQVNRPAVGLPWFDAKNVAWFEYGYDTTSQELPNTTYPTNALVNAPDACIALDSNLGKFAFRNKGAGGMTGAAGTVTCPQWSAAETIGTTVTDSGVTWTAEVGRPYRIDTTITDPTLQFYQNNPWLYQVIGQTFEDPWLHARARNTLVYNNSKIVPCGDAVGPHPCDYTAASQNVTSRYSNFFQNQFMNDPSPGSPGTATYPERLEAVFPTMDYEFWKAIAQSSSNQPGTSIYYFQYVGNGTNNQFQGPNGLTKDVVAWLNAAPNAQGKPYNGLGAGFYFFDTKNGKNPQFNKGGTLTPDIVLNSGSIPDPTFQIRGYIYLNATNFGSKGVGSAAITDLYPMPPEPYRDIGYRKVCDDKVNNCKAGSGFIQYGKFMLQGGTADPPALPSASFVIEGASNGEWDFQDLNGNGQFDVFVADISAGGTVKRPDGTTLPNPTYAPVPYYEGCTVPDPLASPPVTPTAATGCSEPHEPYLNMTYPTTGNPSDKVTVEWYDPNGGTAASYRRPKVRTAVNTGVACTAASSQSDCTSNSYDSKGVDAKGGLVSLSAIAWGAIYNEGGYSGSGNADYYGALLMRGSFNATGTPNVWFDACLATGCLETQLKMQRVMITSLETD